MGSLEVRTVLTWNNLNLRDEIKEKIEALEELQWKEISVHGYDTEENIVTISRHEKSKRYKYPLSILESEETEEEEELPPPEKKERKPFSHWTIISTVAIVVATISIAGTLIFKDYPPSAAADGWLSHIESQKMTQNKNNLLIAEEYQKQKNLRDEIQLSIQRVKSLDQTNKNIERELINYINP